MPINSIEEILEDFRHGKMVLIMDDEDRENEGDLIIAADCITANDVTFFARNACGLICLTLTEEKASQLKLPLMVEKNGSSHSTNFTVSIEAAEGISTGISAAARAQTIKTAVNKNAQPSIHKRAKKHKRQNNEHREPSAKCTHARTHAEKTYMQPNAINAHKNNCAKKTK